MTIDVTRFPNYQRDRKVILKKHRRADEDLSRLDDQLKKQSLSELPFAFKLQGKPTGFPDLWKVKLPIKADNLSALRGLRLIVLREDDKLSALALYTHEQLDSQPPWKEMEKWLGEQRAEFE